MKALRKLTAMLGKQWIYHGKNVTLKDVDITDTGITIETDGKEIKLKSSEIGAFIDECLPVEQKGLTLITPQQTNHLTALKDILMDNITKCQKDPAYIKQATVINNNVNTLINMVSLELKVRKSNLE